MEEAVRGILDFASHQQATPQIAAAYAIMVTEEEGLRSDDLLAAPGTEDAADAVFDKVGAIGPAATDSVLVDLIIDEVYGLPSTLAATLAGFLYAKMREDGVGAAGLFRRTLLSAVPLPG